MRKEYFLTKEACYLLDASRPKIDLMVKCGDFEMERFRGMKRLHITRESMKKHVEAHIDALEKQLAKKKMLYQYTFGDDDE